MTKIEDKSLLRCIWDKSAYVLMNVILITSIVIVTFFIASYAGYGFNLDPNVLTDRTVTPAHHAIYGIVSILPGNGTYCIHAETLSRGEPVTIGLHYIITVPTTGDRFGSTTREQRGVTFITDNNNIVNETVFVPIGATDPIITVSYTNYIDENKVHIIVKRCEGKVMEDDSKK